MDRKINPQQSKHDRKRPSNHGCVRNLIVIFGDQLNRNSSAFDGFHSLEDGVWMAESALEAKHVPSTKSRIALFLSAMRHFRDDLRTEGIHVLYEQLDPSSSAIGLQDLLKRHLKQTPPKKVICVQPGEWRIQQMIIDVCHDTAIDLEIRDDRHFISSPHFFESWAHGRKELRLEHFYRELRKHHTILMENGKKPVGGKWNFDTDNRKPFGSKGPPSVPPPERFPPDATTQEVLALVAQEFGDHPGALDHFSWPVTTGQAERALKDFVDHRLRSFGVYQDAMWRDEPFLYHSLLSAALNLKLLDPRSVLQAAESAYRSGTAPLNAVEGFVRQILGWREFVRHIYWRRMPTYVESNGFQATEPLPPFYWNAQTPLTCLRASLDQTLNRGYAHHIQRLMVLGNFCLLLGTDPKQVHEWFLAVFVDAVEWVEMPNVLGMSQYADGGYMSSKPYAASGKYIARMSNYCRTCPMNPNESVGSNACPFTTLYWDFLIRHRDTLRGNHRMALQLQHLDRLKPETIRAIRDRADQVRNDPSCHTLSRIPEPRTHPPI